MGEDINFALNFPDAAAAVAVTVAALMCHVVVVCL
jgi:hypothetical protein